MNYQDLYEAIVHKHPFEVLHKHVKVLVEHGASQSELYKYLEPHYINFLDSDEEYADVLGDILDRVTGFCGPRHQFFKKTINVGGLRFKFGDVVQAIRHFIEAKRRGDGLPSDLVWGLSSDGILSILSDEIALNPQFQDAIILRAYYHLESVNVIAAIYDFSQALNLDPTNTVLYAGRADAYRMAGLFDLALRDINQVIATLNPISELEARADALMLRSLIYRSLNRLELELDDLKLVISEYPQHPEGEAIRLSITTLQEMIDNGE
jgi:tetratricopeptide (TPR) repeat protein